MTKHERLGPTRLSDHAVAVVIKRVASRAGLSAAQLAGTRFAPGL